MATIIEMPKLSDTMTTGTVVKWHKKIGDAVANGDILAEIETDKATMELENFDDGTLLCLYAQEGDEVDIGAPLALVGEDGEEIPEIKATESVISSSAAEEEMEQVEQVPDVEHAPSSQSAEPEDGGSGNAPARLLASPLAKKNRPRIQP